MSQDFFRIERGLELDETVQILQGSGVPGVSGDSVDAPVGSTYQDNTDGSLFTKISVGAGAEKWQKMASEKYVNDAVGSTVSWREPVVARDNVATVLPVGVAAAPIVIDGVSVTNGGRVLFAAIAGGQGKNIYVYNQAAGTFSEDINQESTGDATYVIGGTSAGKTYVFNGTLWVLTDQSSLDEEGYIRAFVGKAGSGNVLPAYSSLNFILDGQSLEVAIGELDAELGANVATGNFVKLANTVNANIQALDTELGAQVTTGNHISAADSVNQNIQALDTEIGASLGLGNFITSGQKLSSAITALDAELGPNLATANFVDSTVKVNQNLQALDTALGAKVTLGTYVTPAVSANANVQALDTALALATVQTASTNVTSITTIDTQAVTTTGAKWLVRVANVADLTNVYSTEVYAVSNGVSADYTRYATLKIGTAIQGLSVTVDLDGAGALRLRVAAGTAVNVVARRVGVIA
jgi:hypothetical protein